MNFLQGKKTYIIAFLGAIAVFGQLAGLWTVPESVWAMLGVGGLTTLRAGIESKK